jgi:hypothetical protein
MLNLSMRLIVEIHPREKLQMDLLVREGRYATPEQLIEVSIRNQLLLEGEVPTAALTHEAQPQRALRHRPTRVVPDGDLGEAPLSALANTGGRPARTPGLKPAPPSEAVLPHFATKLLPCKVVVRFLLRRLAAAGENELPASDVLAPLQSSAVQLRGRLVAAHKLNPRPRGAFLYAGLPDNDAKSIQRFHELYFLGHPASSGPSTSLSVRLGLIAVRVDAQTGEPRVGLTTEGAAFAALPNPVLDTAGIDSGASGFSDEEAGKLVGLLRDRSPADFSLLGSIVVTFDKAPMPRDELARKLRGAIERLGAKTDAVADGILVAATSRLVELGAATIVKDGLRTGYLAGPRSSLFSMRSKE